jgi:hypothetical protein
VLKTERFEKRIRNTLKVLKCGAGLRIQTISEADRVKNEEITSRKKVMCYVKQNRGRVTGMDISCVGTVLKTRY